MILAPSSIALLAIAAFVAGLVDSIAGGGGLITVPALLAIGLPPHVALATNKGQACFGSASSFTSFWMRGGIDRKRAPLRFALGFVGSLIGARVLLLVDPAPLRPLVLVLLVAAAIVVLVLRPTRLVKPHHAAAVWVAPTVLAIGFYDGFFGPGTGTFLIVAFVLLLGETLTQGSGNAKVVNFASNLAAVVMFLFRGTILWRIALPMAAANALGAFVGAHIAVRGGDRVVRPVVLVVVLALVTKIAWDTWGPH